MTGCIRHAARAMALILLTAGGVGFANAGDLSNTARATATAPGGGAVNSPTSVVNVPIITAVRSMSVTKTGNYSDTDGDPGFTEGDTIAWSVTVQNTGNVTVSSITVADPLVSLICPVSGNNTIASISPGNSVVCTANYSITQASIDNNGGDDGDIDNTATATGSAPGPGGPVVAAGSASVPVVLNPAMSIVKTATLNKAPGNTAIGVAEPDDTIDYTYVLENTGNVTMTDVEVNDAHGGTNTWSDPLHTAISDNGTIGDSPDSNANPAIWGTLAPDDIVTFETTYTVNQSDIDTLQ
jgi:uncharacterized repeat protein (TIGR01451 family)